MHLRWQNSALVKLLRDQLEHSGYSMYRQTTLCPHSECSDVLVGSQNKQRLFPCADLIDRFL